MKRTKKACSGFRPIAEFSSPYNKTLTPSCEHCAYFSSRNCRRDIADIIDTDLDIF